jgi:hypothetical protein
VKVREATLMIRHVSRDKDKIVRHLVREVRDEETTRLSYHSHWRPARSTATPDPKAAHGAGSLEVIPDRAAIGALGPADQDEVGVRDHTPVLVMLIAATAAVPLAGMAVIPSWRRASGCVNCRCRWAGNHAGAAR